MPCESRNKTRPAEGAEPNQGNEKQETMRTSKKPCRAVNRVGAGKAAHQRTLKRPIHCTGIALHSGASVFMTLRPGEPDGGIVFKRTDVDGDGATIPARWDHVVDTQLCTTLSSREGVRIGTVEHLMAALAGCEIDNAVIEVNGPEIPIMDGSAAPFVFLIECAGVVELDAPRRVVRIQKAVTVRDGERLASLFPAEGFSIVCEIDFTSPAVSRQRISVDLVNGTFKKELASARTFGFLHEVEELQAAGLARGGSLDNAVVVSGDKVLNEGGLRYADEFVRHKALDAIGDLYLAGAPIVGRFLGVRSGHCINNLLLRTVFADPAAWQEDWLVGDEMVVAPRWAAKPTAAIAATA